MAHFCSFILHVCTVYLTKLNLEQSLGIFYGDFCVIIIGRVELLSLLLFFYHFIFSLLTEHQTD